MSKVPHIFLLAFVLMFSACAPQKGAVDTAAPSSTPSATFAPKVDSTPAASTLDAVTSTPVPTLAAAGEPEAGDIFATQDGGALVFIPAGEFIMGADADDLLAACESFRSDCRREWFANAEPPRKVTLASFWIDQTEVTNKMYRACVDASVCKPPFENTSATRVKYYDNAKYENHPVIYVSWEQADAYCAWAGRRLPSEAEWEKAARGADGRLFPWGNNPPSSSLLNYALQVGDTSAVKAYPRGVSPYGAFDMAGNVWEWVADWYDASYYRAAPLNNPPGPASGVDKVSRGSAWTYYDFDAFATDRYGNYPKTTNNIIGFRCARDR